MSRNRFIVMNAAVFLVLAFAALRASGPSFRPTMAFKGSSLAGWHTLGEATWTAVDGEIIGTPKQPAGGWLVLDRSFQDVGFYARYRCSAGCTTGVLIRAERLPSGGMKGVYLPLDAAPLRAFAVTLDASGKEVTREPLIAPARVGGAGSGGSGRAAGAPGPGRGQAAGRGPGGRAGTPAGPPDPAAGFSGRAPAGTANLTTPLPTGIVTPHPLTPGEWNEVEIIADATRVRVFVNDSGAGGGGPTNFDAGNYGPIALYVGGTGGVAFKDIAYRDLLIQPREEEKTGTRFRAQQLSDFYYSWGASAADVNHDGVLDVISGPHVFYGPDYTNRREIYVQQTLNPSTEYSTNVWMQFSGDFTRDGWADALNCNQGSRCMLYVNPGKDSRRWDRFQVTSGQNSEIAVIADVNGDGQQDVVYGAGDGRFAMEWATPDPANPTGLWTRHTVSEYGTTIAHGVGVGDVNGDGRADILNAYGWWEQPTASGASGLWTYHPVAFSRSVGTHTSNGGAEMAVFDANGDKLNDVVTSLSAHGYGLAWYEQKRSASGEISFVQHMIMDNFTTQNAGGVTFTEPHGSTAADMNGDGIPDFVVGKKYWSHNDTTEDPDPYGPPVLYVYRTVRNPRAPGGAEFVPELVHNRSGVGTQVYAVDLNKDRRMDLVSPTKFGTYIFWGQRQSPSGQ